MRWAEAWTSRLGGLDRRGLLVTAELVLVLLLAAQGGRIVWSVIEGPAPRAAASARPVAAPVDRSILSRFDPFAPAGAGDELVGVGGEAQAHRLFGVQVDGARSVAIISTSDGQQVSVGVGEPLEAGLILQSVSPDHVILLKGGRSVRLAFEEPRAGPPAGAPSPAAPGAAGGALAAQAIAAPPRRSVGQTPAPPRIDPAALMAQTTLTPRLRGLAVDGFTVTARDDGAALRSAGLQSGDVILSVNGADLDSVGAVKELAGRLRSASSAEIRYQRNRQILTTRIGAAP